MSGGSLLLGIDIGTASAKGVLCTPEGEVVATATIAHETSFPRPGWAEHDADTIWWGEFAQLCRTLLSGRYGPDDVGAVGVSAIGPCMLPVDAAGKPLRPGVLYGIDRRATAEIDLLNERCGADAILALGGTQLTSQAVGPKIRWLREHEPEVFARTAMIQSSQGYVVFRLTGEHRVDRHTASYYTPLFDLSTMSWSDRFADEVIGLDRLPPIVESTDIVGGVTAAASAETGLRVGTPVVMGTMDAVAEAVSVGVAQPGEMLVMYGSTLFLVNVADRPHIDPRIWNTAYCLPGRIAITGGLATSGLLTSWFRDLVRGGDLSEGAVDYATLGARAQAVPAGCDGLVCLPYFAGERNPLHDPDVRGVFAGLTLAHTQGHLYRALLESVGYGFRHNLEVHAEIGAMPRRVLAAGGGVQNRSWVQMLSDIAGVTQEIPEKTIGASYGDAFLAGRAIGVAPEAMTGTWVRVVETVEPDAGDRSVYDETYAIYRSLYPHIRDDLHALGALTRRA
ncbi:MAG: FGGY-family carbohydrate kinase [Thermomicrobiales bacterium]